MIEIGKPDQFRVVSNPPFDAGHADKYHPDTPSI